MAVFDPIPALMENTRAGCLSRIRYDKRDGVEPHWRLIEPKVLVQGVTTILIRALQIDPEDGFKSFSAVRIVEVQAYSPPPAPQFGNAFCTAAIKESARVPSPRSNDANPQASYIDVVRDAVLDGRITSKEKGAVREAAERGRLSAVQIRAAHAMVLAEHLICCANDGSLTTVEATSIAKLCKCLADLGWSPA